MKKLLVMLMLSMVISVYAEYLVWPDNGVNIFENKNIVYNDLEKGANNEIYVLYDADIGNKRRLFLQKYDENNNPLWGENGIRVTKDDDSELLIKHLKIVDGYIYVYWRKGPYDNAAIIIQKVDENGNLLWGDYGLQISDYEVYISYPVKIISDNNDGIYVFWISDYFLKGLHLRSDGVWYPGWNNHGNKIFQQYVTNYFIFNDEDSLAIIYKKPLGRTTKVFMQKMNGNREFIWENPKVLVPTDTRYFKAAVDSEKNFYISYKVDNHGHYNTFVNYFNNRGNPIWRDPINLFEDFGYNAIDVYQFDTASDNGVLLLTNNKRVMKISQNKVLQWSNYIGPNGSYYFLYPDETGGCFTLIRDTNGLAFHSSFLLQHILADGSMMFPENYFITESSYGYKAYLFNFGDHYRIYWNNYQEYVSSLDYVTLISDQVNHYSLDSNDFFYISNYHYTINYQDNILMFYEQCYKEEDKKIFMTNLGDFESISHNKYLILDSLSYQTDFKVASSKYLDEIGFLYQTSNTILNLKIMNSSGSVSHEFTYTPVNRVFHEFGMKYLDLDQNDSDFVVYWIEKYGTYAFNYRVHFMRYHNYQLQSETYYYLGTTDEQKIFYTFNENYFLSAVGETIKLFKFNDNFEIEDGWDEEGNLISTNSENQTTKPQLFIQNGKLFVFFMSANGLYIDIFNENGTQILDDYFITDYREKLMIATREDHFVIFYDNSYFYRRTLDFETYEISNAMEFPYLILDADMQLYDFNNKYYFILNYGNNQLAYLTFNYNLMNPYDFTIRDCYKEFSNLDSFEHNGKLYFFWLDQRFDTNEYYTDPLKHNDKIFGQVICDDANDSENDEIIDYFYLRNFPNPFNPVTKISFYLPKKFEEVKIDIYNLKGSKIRTFKSNNFQTGINYFIWNGKDKNNQDVASGVYLYQLSCDGKPIKVKKCLLLK